MVSYTINEKEPQWFVKKMTQGSRTSYILTKMDAFMPPSDIDKSCSEVYRDSCMVLQCS